MDSVLVIGGTRFVGRHAVEEFLDHDYEVTLLNRGNHENPFADDGRVDRVEGDRTNESALEAARLSVDPDVVVDCVAYHPRDVHAATEVFADVEAYVYVSSGAAYGAEALPKREGETALREWPGEDADADYGQRKAAGDRAVSEAAARGVNATSVRPPVVYGPHDYTERVDYWLHRVSEYDRVLVPGDGTNVWHRAYVEDVASAIRTVAEAGTPGEAYNVADRDATTLAEFVDLAADAVGATVEPVFACARELSTAGLEPGSFPLYRDYPHLLDTNRLAALGWESTPLDVAMDRTAAEHAGSDRDGREQGPAREDEERVLGVLDTL